MTAFRMQTRSLTRSRALGETSAASSPASSASPPPPAASEPVNEDKAASQPSPDALFRELVAYKALNQQLIENLGRMVNLNGRLAERLYKLETIQASVARVSLVHSCHPPAIHPWVSPACEQDDPRVYTPEVNEMDCFPQLSPDTTTEECETVTCTSDSDSDESFF